MSNVSGKSCMIALVLIAVVYGGLFAAIRDETEYGKCVGLNGEKVAGLKYTYSVRNIVIGAVAFQSIAFPVYVALEKLQCPTGKAP